jgi:hypothetical protein
MAFQLLEGLGLFPKELTRIGSADPDELAADARQREAFRSWRASRGQAKAEPDPEKENAP